MLELKNFLESDKLTVIVLIINVQLVSTRKINLVRDMIEQEERLVLKCRKLFALCSPHSSVKFLQKRLILQNIFAIYSRSLWIQFVK